MSGRVKQSVKWSELVARWSSTVASASGILVKARSIVLPYGFIGISAVLRAYINRLELGLDFYLVADDAVTIHLITVEVGQSCGEV
jgi:hypothetical protein